MRMNHYICFLDLLIIKKVRARTRSVSIRLRDYFSYLTLMKLTLYCSNHFPKLIEVSYQVYDTAINTVTLVSGYLS